MRVRESLVMVRSSYIVGFPFRKNIRFSGLGSGKDPLRTLAEGMER